jgi:hypothetical protein
MPIQPRGAGAILSRVEQPYERSRLFEWLIEHHDEMVVASGGRRMEWRRLCADFAQAGLTDADGNAVTARTARMTWWRVRKERARIEARRAAERAERDRRAATNARREMPSQLRKGDYGPPLATVAQQPKPPATTVKQAEEGLLLSTAEGVVITRISRVFKLDPDGPDYRFDEKGYVAGTDGWAAMLRAKQQLNWSGSRPINDSTEDLYARIGLRSEDL